MKVLLSSKVLCCCDSVQNSHRAISPHLMEGPVAISGVFSGRTRAGTSEEGILYKNNTAHSYVYVEEIAFPVGEI